MCAAIAGYLVCDEDLIRDFVSNVHFAMLLHNNTSTHCLYKTPRADGGGCINPMHNVHNDTTNELCVAGKGGLPGLRRISAALLNTQTALRR